MTALLKGTKKTDTDAARELQQSADLEQSHTRTPDTESTSEKRGSNTTPSKKPRTNNKASTGSRKGSSNAPHLSTFAKVLAPSKISATTPMEADDNDEATVVQDNSTPAPTLYDTRVQMKISVEGSNRDNYEPLIEVLRKIKTLLEKGQVKDKYFAFRKWRQSAKAEYVDIVKPSDIPIDEDTVGIYFYELDPYDHNRAQDCWFQCRLIHSVELSSIRKEMSRWMRRHKIVMKENQLQCEDKEEVFFAVNAHRNMCVHTLRDDILVDSGVDTQCTYKVIYGGQRKGTKIPEKDKVRTIHISVDAKGWQKSFQILSDKYGSRGTTLPKGRRMRLMPIYNKAKSIPAKAKVKCAIIQQRNFEATIRRGFTSDILLLDTKKANTKGTYLPTLREMIGEIKSSQEGVEHIPLFHSIDPGYAGPDAISDNFVYTYMPNLEEEAITMMDNIIPYLRYKYGRTVHKYFDPDVVEGCKKDKWDPAKKCVNCVTDTNLESALDDLDMMTGLAAGIAFMESKAKAESITKADETLPQRPEVTKIIPPQALNLQPAPVQTALQNIPQQAQAYFNHKDDDSISTMGFSAIHSLDGQIIPTSTHASIPGPKIGDIDGTVTTGQTSVTSTTTPSTNSNLPISHIFHPQIVETGSTDTNSEAASSVTNPSQFDPNQLGQLLMQNQQMLFMYQQLLGSSAASQPPASDNPNGAGASSSQKEPGKGL